MKTFVIAAIVAAGVLVGCGKNNANLMPKEQAAFENARHSRLKSYDDAANEIKKSEIFLQANEESRRAAAAVNGTAQNWVAKIIKLETSHSGADAKVKLKSPLGSEYETGIFTAPIEKNGAVYKQLADLKEGDWVRFSGPLVAKTGGNYEWSLTEHGSLRRPEYQLNLASIVALQQ